MHYPNSSKKPERIYYIDWLRVLAMIIVFLFHSGRAFDHRGWHIKNSQHYLAMDVFIGFLVIWMMPTFFIISGISAFYSLNHQKAGQYILAKLKRLLVPLVFGIFVLVPHQVYFEMVSNSKFAGSFIDFYPHYFDGFYGFGGNFAWMGLHLWYLLFLFIFSLLALPLFLYARRDSMKRLVWRVSDICNKPGGIFLPIIPIFAVSLLLNLNPEGIGRRDFGGWSLFIYLLIFIYGYFIASDISSRQSFEKNRILALIIAVTTTVIYIIGGVSPSVFSFIPKNIGYFLASLVSSLSLWFWLIAIIGFGIRYLDFSNRFLKYANEAVMPFYVLHQSIIVLVGYYVIRWDSGLLIKFSFIVISSFVAILFLYEFLIRRINLLRFLYGMKLRNNIAKNKAQ